MDLAAVAGLNRFLSELEPTPFSGVMYLDTMHHPFAWFPESFVWPSVTVTGIHFQEADHVVRRAAELMPSFVAGCHLLPEPRPRKDSNQVHLVRPHSIGGRDYLYILKFSAEYMGGSTADEVVRPAAQGISPAFRTQHVYFTARLLPVQSITRSGDCITDFEALQFKDAIFKVNDLVEDDERRTLFATMLFDEVDFTHIEDKFRDLFDFGTKWGGGTLIPPFVIEHLTLTLNLLQPEPSVVAAALPRFDRAFTAMAAGSLPSDLSPEDQGFWRDLFGAVSYQREASRAGNARWRLTSLPDAAWAVGRSGAQ